MYFQAKNRIKHLEDTESAIEKAIESYTALINGEEGATEPAPVSLTTTPSLDQDFSTRATVSFDNKMFYRPAIILYFEIIVIL